MVIADLPNIVSRRGEIWKMDVGRVCIVTLSGKAIAVLCISRQAALLGLIAHSSADKKGLEKVNGEGNRTPSGISAGVSGWIMFP